MLNKLLSWFKKRPADSIQQHTADTNSSSAAEVNDNPSTDPIWLDADHPRNPFRIAGCDCFAYTQSLLSTTTKENVESYFKLRHDYGERLIGHLPEDPVEIPCQLEYAYSGEVADGAIFKAQRMEEKWDIYLHQSKIYFCRSWLGTLVYVGDIEFSDGKVRISKLFAPRELAGDDLQYCVQQVDYLKKSHIFQSVEPHPLPKDFPNNLMQIAAFSFNQYGSKCCFATYEDTIHFRCPPRPDV